MQKLGFLDYNIEDPKLKQIIDSQPQNFTLKNSDGVVKNFFKILCAIDHIGAVKGPYSQLDNKVLNTYLNNLNLNKPDPAIVILDQISTIRYLVNREAYSLNTS
jgi:hypothetical protein